MAITGALTVGGATTLSALSASTLLYVDASKAVGNVTLSSNFSFIAISGTLTLASNLTGINSVTSTASANLVLATGTFGAAITVTSATGAITLAQGTLSFTGATTITGGAGNMTITAGTGASRTLALQSTTSGSTATTFLTGDANQLVTVANSLAAPTSILSPILDSNANTDTLIKRNGTTGITLGASSAVTLAGSLSIGTGAANWIGAPGFATGGADVTVKAGFATSNTAGVLYLAAGRGNGAATSGTIVLGLSQTTDAVGLASTWATFGTTGTTLTGALAITGALSGVTTLGLSGVITSTATGNNTFAGTIETDAVVVGGALNLFRNNSARTANYESQIGLQPNNGNSTDGRWLFRASQDTTTSNDVSLIIGLNGVVNTLIFDGGTTAATIFADFTGMTKVGTSTTSASALFTSVGVSGATYIGGLLNVAASTAFITSSGATTNGRWLRITNTSGDAYIGVESSVGGSILTGATGYATVISSLANKPVQIGSNDTLAATFLGANTTLAGTITVSGTGNALFGGGAQFGTASTGGSSLIIGPTTPTNNGSGFISFINSNTVSNWLIGSNQNAASTFEITPSTATGGSTFTTPRFSLTTTTLTMASTIVSTFNNSTASTSSTTGSVLTAGGFASSNTTDAVSATNGGTFTSAGGGAFAKTFYTGSNVFFGQAASNAVLTLGFVTSGNTSPFIKLYGGSSPYGWQISTNNTIGDAFEIAATTAAGGTTFASPWLKIAATSGLITTGAALTSTGLITASAGLTVASGQTTTLGGIMVVSTDTLSGAGAVSVTKDTTKVTTTGVANALTLADGTDGQIKHVIHDVDGGSFVLTPATKTGYTTITSLNAGDSVTLEFVATRGWIVVGSYGVAIA